MKKRNWIALIITILLLIFIFYKIDFHELFATLKNFQIKYLIYIVPLYVLTLYLRGVRWKYLLLNDSKYSAYNLAQVFTAGSMMNSFLPARAGDIYRAYYLGDIMGEKKMKVFGSVILERIFDGIAVFLILLISVIMYAKQDWIIKFTIITGILFIGALLGAYFVLRFNKLDIISEKIKKIVRSEKLKLFIEKTFAMLKSFIDGLEVLKHTGYFNMSLAISVLIWLIEAFVAVLVMASLEINPGISAGLFAISLTSLSTVIPSTSVFLGPYQYAYILALGLYNINKSTALAVSAMHQAILMLILAVIGGLCLLKFNIKTKKDL